MNVWWTDIVEIQDIKKILKVIAGKKKSICQ